MSSRRMERVASLLKQAIGRVIVSDLSDPRMGFVTVVKVEPSADLRTAKVFVSVLGEPADVRRTLHGLRHAARFVKHRVADEIEMRSVPDLAFVEDQSVKGAARVSKLIDDAMAQIVPLPGEPPAGKDAASRPDGTRLSSRGDSPLVPRGLGVPEGGSPREGPGGSDDVTDDELETILEERRDEEELDEEGPDEDDEDEVEEQKP